jgi:hypothetical protein
VVHVVKSFHFLYTAAKLPFLSRQAHFLACIFIPIPCIFGCGEMVKQSDIGRHRETCKIANSAAKKEVTQS